MSWSKTSVPASIRSHIGWPVLVKRSCASLTISRFSSDIATEYLGRERRSACSYVSRSPAQSRRGPAVHVCLGPLKRAVFSDVPTLGALRAPPVHYRSRRESFGARASGAGCSQHGL